MKKKQGSRKWTVLILLLLLIALGLSGRAAWNTWFRPVPQSEFNPVDLEMNAEELLGDEDQDGQSGINQVSVTAKTEMTVRLESGTAELYYANLSSTNQDVILALYVEDAMVYESGVLPPGYKVEHLDGLTTNGLEPGTYKGTIQVFPYDRETGERKLVNTALEISVHVVE